MAQNHYKYLPVEDLWGDWRDGPNSAMSLHATGPQGGGKSCIDCHFAKSNYSDEFRQGHHGHGGTYAAPGAASSELSKLVKLEVFAIRRAASSPGGLERLDAPLASRQLVLQPG